MGGIKYTGPAHQQDIRVKGGISLNLALGASIGAIIFVIIVLLAAFFIWRRRHPSYMSVVRFENGEGR